MPHINKFNLRWYISIKQFSLLRLIGILSFAFVSLLPLLMVSTSSVAGAGTVWTNQVSAADNNWTSVTYGNGLFVAVSATGKGNRVMTSSDGSTWTIRTSAADNCWVSVTYGNGLFVAVASTGDGNRVMTSLNGITWTIRTSAADNYWTSVTYGNGLFVAVASSGAGNRVMTSPDGITWTSQASSVDNYWFSVTYGNGLFLAVASSGTGNRAMTSPDGITWTSQVSVADNCWFSVTYGNGLFVAVSSTGTSNRVMTSPDGITWTRRTSAADNYWFSITYGNGLFVAVSSTGIGNRVMTSPDGITWTIRTSAADNYWTSITYGNGLFVAVALTGSGNRVMLREASLPPTVSVITPAYGVTVGGTAVTLTGSRFTDATEVSIGGIAATNVKVVSDTSITTISLAHIAGTASVLVTTPGGANTVNSLFKYTDCGPGVSIITGTTGLGALWQMLALPCVPATSTIAGVFGDNPSTLSNLLTANYAKDQTNIALAAKDGWIIEKKTVGAVPAYEPLLSADLALSVGTGYWIKSYQAPTNGKLSMDGTATPTDVTQAEGCYSANGCKAIIVTTYKSTYNRNNLVGNPFPYAIDWTKVRIRVDGSETTYTPAQAAGVVVGDPLNLATPVISNVVNIWNATCTGYDAFTDIAPYPSTPNLQYFKSFWVNVLPGAFGHTVELLIPAEQSTLSLNTTVAPVSTGSIEQVAKLDLPWYLAWLDVVVSPAYAAPAVSNHVKPQMLANANDWYIRLKVDNPVTGWSDHNSLLGELMDANIGFDPHDVQEMSPYAAPYLTLVFPKPEWDVNAGDYASDFHRFNLKVQTWNFEVRAKPIGSKVFLSWEGSPALLKRSRLIEIATGKIILPSDPRWKAKGYPIKLTNAVQKYTWKVLTL